MFKVATMAPSSCLKIKREISFKGDIVDMSVGSGFKPMSGEGKVMGLAPYGKPKYELKDFVKETKNGIE